MRMLSDHLPSELTDDLPDWFAMCEPLEGRVYGFYLDVKGLVTVGVGNLRDTVESAARLPLRVVESAEHLGAAPEDAPRATSEEIRQAWHDLKQHQALRNRHWREALKRNRLRLTKRDVDKLVAEQLYENERFALRDFPMWRSLPADLQLCIMSIAWAAGPAFARKWPRFTAAVHRGDYVTAGLESQLRTESNPGIVPRNRLHTLLCRNAHIVQQDGLDVDTLFWPLELAKAGDDARDTTAA